MSTEKYSYSSAPGSISLTVSGGTAQVTGGDDMPGRYTTPDSWISVGSATAGADLALTVRGAAYFYAATTSDNETINLVGNSSLYMQDQMTFGSLTVSGGSLSGISDFYGTNVTLNTNLAINGADPGIVAGSSPLNAAGDVIANSVVHINGAADANTVIYMDGTNAPSMGLPAPEVLVAHPGEFHAVTTFSGSGAPGVLGLLGAVASSYNIKADLTNPSVLDLDLYGPKGGLLDTVTLQDTIMDQHVYVAQCALGVYVSTNTADLEMGGSMHLLSVHS